MLICDISILNRYGKQLLDEQLAGLKIEWHQLVVLLVLSEVPGIPQMRLAPFLQTDKANVTKILQGMERSRLIHREADEKDQRSKRCRLTKKGEDLVPLLRRIMAQWEAACFAGISREDRETFQRISGRITENLMPVWGGDEESGRAPN